MLRRRKVLNGRWARGLVAVSVALGLTVCGSPALARDQDSGPEVSGGQSADGGGQISVTVETTVTTVSNGGDGGGGTTSSETTQVSVRPVCWYEQTNLSGADMAARIGPEGAHTMVESGLESYASHAAEDGRWYRATCDPHADPEALKAEVRKFWMVTRRWRWVPAGQEPPAPVIDARTLVRAAMGAVRIPVPEVETNPRVTTGDGVSGATVVGLDTWVWATGETSSQVRVTASAGSLSATVVASASGLRVSAPDSVPSCTGWGSPWVPGQSQEGGSDCTVEFTRSSAHLGGTTPLTVSVGYDVAWTATDGTSGTLDPITTTSTTDLPVAEIQTINRDTSH